MLSIEGTISPVFEDDLTCHVFEDGHYAKLQEKLADLFETEDSDEDRRTTTLLMN
jgi:hypothetical protein